MKGLFPSFIEKPLQFIEELKVKIVKVILQLKSEIEGNGLEKGKVSIILGNKIKNKIKIK